MSDRLFTPRFLTMFGFSFTVFVSVFQLLPTSPYRILDLGGTTTVAGLFQGFLTLSSAASAPLAGPLTDRLGHRRVLVGVSLLLAGFSASYAFIDSVPLLLTVVVAHGVVWSALLSASGAYMTATIPPSRRAEGLGYWGLASVMAIGTATALGFLVYRYGWSALCFELCGLNLLMALIAWRLPDDRHDGAGLAGSPPRSQPQTSPPTRWTATWLAQRAVRAIEWRVIALSGTTAVVSFGYGALTSFSALFADALSLSPRSLFLTAMAVATAAGRLVIGRSVDSIGPRRMLTWCLMAPPVGLLALAFTGSQIMFVTAALIFGAGFGLMLPAYHAYVLEHVPARRRGAAFGAMLAAFDTGIGTGASVTGWLVHAYGFRVAFGASALVAALALPYFFVMERRLGFVDTPSASSGGAPS